MSCTPTSLHLNSILLFSFEHSRITGIYRAINHTQQSLYYVYLIMIRHLFRSLSSLRRGEEYCLSLRCTQASSAGCWEDLYHSVEWVFEKYSINTMDRVSPAAVMGKFWAHVGPSRPSASFFNLSFDFAQVNNDLIEANKTSFIFRIQSN
jgi:hypothetical protein